MTISPPINSRHRLASCNSQYNKPRQHYLSMVTNTNSYRIKANSLPSILDSENDPQQQDNVETGENLNKSPLSIASCTKKRQRSSKPWKYLQRQRTTEEMTPLETTDKFKSSERIIKRDVEILDCKNEELNGLNGVSSYSYKFYTFLFNKLLNFRSQ